MMFPLVNAGTQEEEISSLIYNYAISIPNLEVRNSLEKCLLCALKCEIFPLSYLCRTLSLPPAINGFFLLLSQLQAIMCPPYYPPSILATTQSFIFILRCTLFTLWVS